MDTLMLIAVLTSPVIAVIITLWHQGRKEKRTQKIRTFFTLVALRDSMPIPYDFVTALNTIDVVFHNDLKVLAAWKKYYENLNSDNSPASLKARTDLKLDLLYEMSQVLGYKNWKQTEMNSYYIPVQHYDQNVLNAEIQKELLTYLKKSNKFYERLEAKENYEERQENPV
jgi:hypothetical protein